MINSQWRAVQSFQENQNLISAINTLSIYIKLEMAGRSDMNRAKAIPAAAAVRQTLDCSEAKPPNSLAISP